MSRVICWFSHGAASAVAAKLAIDEFGDRAIVVCCDTRPSEHEDNYRFTLDVELWLGRDIVFIRNDKYSTVDEVFEMEKYMSGQAGARCTTEVKKIPRMAFQQADDIHVWGYTAGERKRVNKFKKNNPEIICRFLLVEHGYTKAKCLQALRDANIELPMMYRIFDEEDRKRYKQDGFDNNNCPGCVKASSKWYWDNIRKYFPAVFERRAKQSRAIGCRLVELTHHKRIFLDELPPGPFKKRKFKENLSCGPECGIQGGKS